METVSIIGPGRLGGALAIALFKAGYSIDRLVYRGREPSRSLVEKIGGSAGIIRFDEVSALDSDVVVITTQDTYLGSVAESIATKIRSGSVLLHTSGALSSQVLSPAARLGAVTGSMHPLVSVSDSFLSAAGFAGAFFCLEGDETAINVAERMVRSVGGTPFSIDTNKKPLYHAAAVLASGHIVALFSAAARTLSNSGVGERKADEILLPLVKSTLENLSNQSIAAALTGPFARADLEAVVRHVAAFDSAGLEDEKRIYLEIGLEALRLAEAGGVDGSSAARIRKFIKLAQQSTK